ncbi:MAG: hypothetical protein ABF913_07155 [Oenococcus sp.]
MQTNTKTASAEILEQAKLRKVQQRHQIQQQTTKQKITNNNKKTA